MLSNIKGVFATAVSGASALAAWLIEIEIILRVGVALVGIIAGIYAARYWRKKEKLLKDGKDSHNV